MPPDGIIWSVLNEQIISQYHVRDTVIGQQPVTVVGIDPDSAGGDKCINIPSQSRYSQRR